MKEYTYSDEVRDAGSSTQSRRNQPAFPREKLMYAGHRALSDQELLAILLNRRPAKELLECLDREKEIPTVHELAVSAGLGESAACSVIAMLEFGRRRWGPAGTKVKRPQDIYRLISHYADRRQERFICLSLNGAHEVMAVRLVTLGLVNRTIVHPREVFADPIADRAAAVIVAHNHPSGRLMPSSEDNEITRLLIGAADILGLHFLDHLIFSETAFFSYRQSGKL